jgi:hypothetical protein
VCTGANPVVCSALDQCHAAGVCNPATGVCSNPKAPNGAACNDGNACTQADTCQAGACTGASPVVCAAPDQCHDAGVCNAATGAVLEPAAANGTACNDGNACTQSDTCQAGSLHRGEPGGLFGFGSMPLGGYVRYGDGRLLEPVGGERDGLQRRQRVYAERHVPVGHLHGGEPGGVLGFGSVPFGGYVQHGDGRLLEPVGGERDGLQRRQRVYAE